MWPSFNTGTRSLVNLNNNKDVTLTWDINRGAPGVNRRFEVQKAAAALGAYAAMALVAVLGVILWTVSYNRNRGYVDTWASARKFAKASWDEGSPALTTGDWFDTTYDLVVFR